ncbi:MAG: DUF374 domain-containing protein [Polyangiaceae bacterium]
MIRRALGVLLGWVARLWLATLRPVVVGGLPSGGPFVFALCHGQQFCLLAARPTASLGVLVSRSNDGEIQAAALPRLGLEVRRGSSSRGGAAGLAAMVRLLRAGISVAFAVDGPRGPYGVPHPGALAAAKAAGAVVVPLAAFAPKAWVLSKAWDRFELPLPGSHVYIAVGAPLELGGESIEDSCERLQTALRELRSGCVASSSSPGFAALRERA